ncbi:MAG TPA: hypothetical protein VFU36_13245 [Jatrophihabitans sp.]|nr:hypothetical protein [Jatrophihabitans sp.]
MTVTEAGLPARRRTMLVPRSRGAVSGFLLILLGAWGALVPFFGPYLDYSYGTDQAWHWTAARGWLEVLPGVAVVLGGLLLLVSAHRVSASFGGWLAALGGAWFIVGQSVAPLLHLGSIGQPLSHHQSGRAAAELGYFYALGAVILFLAAFALGRLAVVGVRDVLIAERAAEAARADEELARRRAAERDAATTGVAGDRVAGDRVARDGVADDRVGVARDGVVRDDVARDGVARDGVARDGVVRDGVATRDARSEPDRPYLAQSGDEPTARYNPDMVGSDYGTTTRSPAHQAPGEDGR